MQMRHLYRAALAAAVATALPLLAFLAWYARRDYSGEIGRELGGSMVAFALFVVLFVLFCVLASMYAAVREAGGRRVVRRSRHVAATVLVVAATLVTITWLVWAQGARWPLAEPRTYLALAGGIVGLSLLFLPGALLQAWMLDRLATNQRAGQA